MTTQVRAKARKVTESPMTDSQRQQFADTVAAKSGQGNKFTRGVKKAGNAVGGFFRNVWKGLCWLGRKIRGGAKATGRGAVATGKGVAWLLYQLGRGLAAGASLLGKGLAYAVTAVAFVLLTAISVLAVAVLAVVYFLIVLVQAIALAIATPHYAVHGQAKAQWKQFWAEITHTDFRNEDKHLPNLVSLKTEGAEQDGKPEGKGRPTPKQAKRRPARMPAPSMA